MSRVVFFVSSMQGGGAERVAALLCNHWVGRGHEVMLVPTFSGRGECLYPLDERVQLVYLADCVGTTRRTPWTMVRRLLAMRRLVKEFGAHAVVSFLTDVNVATLCVTRGLNVTVVVAERIYPPAFPLSRFWARMRRWSYPWASAVVMQTQRGLDWLNQSIPASPGYVIPNPNVFPLPGGEPRVSPTAVVAHDRNVLLAVGRLEDQKQFALLIRAFSDLARRYPVWDLVVLGEGSQRAMLESQLAATAVAHHVHLPGRVGNLADWYERADVYVMSSRFEGFPNTLMEAMAHGLPAVSFDCDTGPADLISDGIDGYLVPPSKGAQGLADRLGALMADAEKRDVMSQQAVKVRERFSMDKVAAQWSQVLGLSV